jgi:hypothetical protein
LTLQNRGSGSRGRAVALLIFYPLVGAFIAFFLAQIVALLAFFLGAVIFGIRSGNNVLLYVYEPISGAALVIGLISGIRLAVTEIRKVED